jgi:hypothetical protein
LGGLGHTSAPQHSGRSSPVPCAAYA